MRRIARPRSEIPRGRRNRWSRRTAPALRWAAIALALAWTLFPFAWAAVLSVKPTSLEYRSVYLPFVQFRPTLAHWRWEWAQRREINGLEAGLLNSLAVGFAVAALSTAVGVLAAVGLDQMRARPRWRGGMLALLVLSRVVPPIVLVGPVFLLSRQVHLHDTLAALVLIHTGLALPLAVIVLDGAIRDVPRDLLDAARLEGASGLRIAGQIVAPLLLPILVAIGTFSFAMSWVEFLFALTNHAAGAFTLTLSVAFLEERDGVQFEHVGSHLVLILLPPLILAFLAQRAVTRGLSLGAARRDG